VDCGPGCGRRLHEAGYSVRDVDAVYVSHMHMDHWSGLFELAVYAEAEAAEMPPLLAPPPVASSYEAIAGLLPRRARPRLQGLEPGKPLRLGGLGLSPVEARHSVPCYGLLAREEGGASLLYTSDTAPSRLHEELAPGIDLLVTEATMPAGMEAVAEKTGHQTVPQALRLSRLLPGHGLLALVHLSAQSWPEASRVSGRRVLVAADLSILSL
jgi:ribonuclease Z